MSRRWDTRLGRLAKRVDGLVERLHPEVGSILVIAPDAEHPHGTRVRRSRGLTVYHDLALGEPDLPEVGRYTIVISFSNADVSRPIPFPEEMEGNQPNE